MLGHGERNDRRMVVWFFKHITSAPYRYQIDRQKFCFRSKSLFIDLILSYEEHAVTVLIWHFLMIITHNITIIGTPSNPTFCFRTNIQKKNCFASSPKMSI